MTSSKRTGRTFRIQQAVQTEGVSKKLTRMETMEKAETQNNRKFCRGKQLGKQQT